MNDNELPSQIWFTARWITGYLVDLLITVGGVSAMVWSMTFYLKHPLRDLPLLSDQFLAHPVIAFGVGLGVFASFMSGRQWVRTQYFHHVLPEVWNDAIQNFIKNANKEEQERKEK